MSLRDKAVMHGDREDGGRHQDQVGFTASAARSCAMRLSAYSSFAPLARTRAPQRSRSCLMNSAISAGVLPTASILPISNRRFAMSGWFSISETAADSLNAIAAGVLGG